MTSLDLHTPTASCGSCRANIAEAFESVAGVESAVLDLDTKHTTVTYDPETLGKQDIVRILVEAGYAPEA